MKDLLVYLILTRTIIIILILKMFLKMYISNGENMLRPNGNMSFDDFYCDVIHSIFYIIFSELCYIWLIVKFTECIGNALMKIDDFVIEKMFTNKYLCKLFKKIYHR